ncbi:MAG: hypothetical protein DDT29_01331 [Dehalococcoidia bacterium]|nr:hypothetical protein [Bacillota bacterium]
MVSSRCPGSSLSRNRHPALRAPLPRSLDPPAETAGTVHTKRVEQVAIWLPSPGRGLGSCRGPQDHIAC